MRKLFILPALLLILEATPALSLLLSISSPRRTAPDAPRNDDGLLAPTKKTLPPRKSLVRIVLPLSRVRAGRTIADSAGEASTIGVNFFLEYFSAASICGYIRIELRGCQCMW